MTRREKYPDTNVFTLYNANPKNRITGDCTFRAFSTAMEVPYQDVVMEMAQLHCETGYAADDLIDRYMDKKGWKVHKQPRKPDGTKYTGERFCELIQIGKWPELTGKNIVANIGGHHIVAIVDGKVLDIWDSTSKCIGKFWTKD